MTKYNYNYLEINNNETVEVKFIYNSLDIEELSDNAGDHIINLINEGFTEGELVYEDEEGKLYTGHWELVNLL